jgi:hypothetical protein
VHNQTSHWCAAAIHACSAHNCSSHDSNQTARQLTSCPAAPGLHIPTEAFTLGRTVLCCAVLCCAVLCCAVLCCAVPVACPAGSYRATGGLSCDPCKVGSYAVEGADACTLCPEVGHF